MEDIDKEQVRRAMAAQLGDAADSSRRSLSVEHSAAELDPGSSYSIDDLSQSDDDGQWVGLYQRVDADEAATSAAIQGLDLSPKSSIGPGAIAQINGLRYVIGIAASQFSADGFDYIGIATDAPIYSAMAGLAARDSFTFRGSDYLVEAVW